MGHESFQGPGSPNLLVQVEEGPSEDRSPFTFWLSEFSNRNQETTFISKVCHEREKRMLSAVYNVMNVKSMKNLMTYVPKL